MFKTQFTNLQQPTYESDSELDIFHTCDSQNLSCSNYANLTYKEIKKDLEVYRFYQKKKEKEIRKLSNLQKKTQDSLHLADKKIILQPDKVITLNLHHHGESNPNSRLHRSHNSCFINHAYLQKAYQRK